MVTTKQTVPPGPIIDDEDDDYDDDNDEEDDDYFEANSACILSCSDIKRSKDCTAA